MGEKNLHLALKKWYSHPDDLLEAHIDGHNIDILRGDQVIEIQTANFSAIKPKLKFFLNRYSVHLVHPISEKKWIVRIDSKNKTLLSRRKSPRKGRVEDIFFELVYIPLLMKNPNFSLEVLLINSEEILVNDGLGSWRRNRWSIHNRKLLNVIEQFVFSEPTDFLSFLPSTLPEEFTTKDLAMELKLQQRIAQKMAYCLRLLGVIKIVGKRKRATLYSQL
jgi:hypothetical protein|tara:strand:+ start:558 stop:1217 length:660 start_codon:yes stop_codon:yes gene_type:complete